MKLEETATGNTFPEQPMGARIIVEPIETLQLEEVESGIIGGTKMYRKPGSQINMSQQQVDAIRQELEIHVQPAKVVAVGAKVELPISVGDTVKIYLNQFEAAITHDDIRYLIYAERNIITKVN